MPTNKLLLSITILLILALCSTSSFALQQNDQEVDFDKLFDNPKSKSSVLSTKRTSELDKEKAKAGTDNISTPMTLLGMGAKSMFTCEDCESSSGNYISVNFEGVCGLIGCATSNLKIWGGPGEFKPSYNKAASGTLLKGYNGLVGNYKWSAVLDDNYTCTGNFTIDEPKQQLNLYAYSKCSSTYYNY
eukprot:TRINITY_DN6_c0_g7_i1.p1 TRINITY_DN6_c0_g7~~TRINITY_DN6_c0_g7_i1.p1  ORF type:complete len:188 (+),score=21.71 TRINITY_DN6_c0_g7_i1:132-695(+)